MKSLSASIWVATALVVAIPLAWGQDSTAGHSSAQPPDNTRENKMETNRTVTADSQKENAGDRQVIQRIRRSVVADKSLSMYAHNVKIVSLNGQVTLNGVVHSDQEKTTVEQKAVAVAGQGHVTNEIKVSAK